MSDNLSDLWESELLRARQWLAARRDGAESDRGALFLRVKAHIGYKDHQRSLQSDAVASDEDENDLALDFLGDVDAADMNALLQAEAAKASVSKVPPVELATASRTGAMASMDDLLKPLEMPPHLSSPVMAAGNIAVPMSQLNPKHVASGTASAAMPSVTSQMATSASLGNDAAVNELMQDLQLDMIHVQQSDHEEEERKTEESTPPHLLKSFAANTSSVSNDTTKATKFRGTGTTAGQPGDATGNSVPSKYAQQASSKSPEAPHKKKAVALTSAHPDSVAAELHSWVSGYRDPAVVRRKEMMARRKRRFTNRYGVSSLEEQRQMLQKVKQLTPGSGSDSEDNDCSDYMPEEEEMPERDEAFDESELLSDDYLNSDENERPIKRRRELKRLRQADAARKKKISTRTRKPAVTHKLIQREANDAKISHAEQTRPVANSEKGEGKHRVCTSTAILQKPGEALGKASEPIDLLSSGDEARSEQRGELKAAGCAQNKASARASIGTTSSESDGSGGSKDARLRMTTPTNQKTLDSQDELGQSKRKDEKPALTVPRLSTAQPADNRTNGTVDPGLERVKLVASDDHTRDGKAVHDLNTQAKTPSSPLNATGDDPELSDTGTLDLEQEDLSVESMEADHGDEDKAISPEMKADGKPSEAQAGVVANGTGESSAQGNVTAGKEQPSGDVNDEGDISEAETEVFEDEGASDDLGLDYSDDSDIQQTGPGPAKSNKAPAPAVGVQQFFDFVPLKLKPKSNTTARKPLPRHDDAETHSSKRDSAAGKSEVDKEKLPAATTAPSIGSNGLRPSKKRVAISTSSKGKQPVPRRSTKLLSPNELPGSIRQQKGRYAMVPTQASSRINLTEGDSLKGMPSLAKEMSKGASERTDARYLSYNGAKKTEDAPRFAAEKLRFTPKSRYGGGGGQGMGLQVPDLTRARSADESTDVAQGSTNGGSWTQANGVASRGGFRREPQISIYDALSIDGQENAGDIREETGYKRPNRFKKLQAEAARTGVPLVKSRLQDTDWDKVPIPKKKKQPPQSPPTREASRKSSTATGKGPANSKRKTKNSRRKQDASNSSKKPAQSYYGPQSSQATTKTKERDSYSRDYRNRESSTSRRNDDRRMRRSLSPLARVRNGHDASGSRHNDRRGRGRSRSRSRSRSHSPGPRDRDRGNNHHTRASRSRSWSRERSSERDHSYTGRSARSDRDRDQNSMSRRRSPSPNTRKKRDSAAMDNPPELERSYRDDEEASGRHTSTMCPATSTQPVKKQKTSHHTAAPPSPGGLATFDDDDTFISDSDEDGNMAMKEVENIRFDLESVPVDEALMAKRVYVTGLNPSVCAEQLEEDFGRFGLAVRAHLRLGFCCMRLLLAYADGILTVWFM
ncbi:hypothetical protein BBJ28_00003294 [Nothophytophthora sp. Chile5]|nr:hypothetical protein BBJ28_00003294 [Nothophytophthora sp. Chile5]